MVYVKAGWKIYAASENRQKIVSGEIRVEINLDETRLILILHGYLSSTASKIFR